MDSIAFIKDLFQNRGSEAYFGEAVSQREHALQSAYLAHCDGGPDSLVAAALLHDIGHLLGMQDDAAEHGIDAFHEEIGCAWLDKHFGREVSEPVRLHVAAKRYLCAVEPEYPRGLSPASVTSLGLQGGPMGAEEIRQFEDNPFHSDAVRLRRWDDEAKVPDLSVPGLEAYIPILEGLRNRPVA
jgi:[1-hydroxy-2-(trimethylamino)ethyl]phosphonate dioxygenase